jgi:hypothetical protein
MSSDRIITAACAGKAEEFLQKIAKEVVLVMQYVRTDVISGI